MRLKVKEKSEQSLLKHLDREWHDEDGVRIGKELRARAGMLFTVLVEPGVKWHDNDAET